MTGDLSALGFSYWRRAHQLPGVHYCWEHQTRLKNTNTSDYLVLPHEIALNNDCDECPTPSCSDLEERYNQLLQRILKEPLRLSMSQMLGALRERTKALGYSTTQYNHGGDRPPVSAYFEQQYGHDITLLGLHDPDLETAPRNVALYLHVGTLYPQGFLLLAAALCQSLDDAISLMDDRTPRPSKQRNDISDYHFRRAYLHGKGVRSAMAKILGVTKENVRILFRSRPYIELNETPCRNTLQALIAFTNGQTLEEACQTYGVKTEAVENLIRDVTRYPTKNIQKILPNLV